MRHVPAHRTEAAARGGELTLFELVGNRRADTRAKEGAAFHAIAEQDALMLEGCLARAKEVA
eukprot:8083048-Pyramimonas_sp.AAC.1